MSPTLAPTSDDVSVPVPDVKAAHRLSDLVRPLEILAGVVFTLASIYLHFFQRHSAGGLWRDEATSAQIANLPTWGQLWRYLEFDSYPPLFHLVLRGWCALFSSGDASLRTLGLLIGLGVLAGVWTAARAVGVRVPLLALVLLGLNPMMIRYGDSIRAYGLGCGLALLTFAAVWRVAAAPCPGWRGIVLAAVSAVVSVQGLYHNAVLLLASCLAGAAVACRERRPKAALVVLAIGMPAAVSLLPYLPVIARTRGWSPLLKVHMTAALMWTKLSDVTGSPDPLGVWLWSVLVVVGIALTIWSLRSMLPERRLSIRLYAAIWLAVGGVFYAGFLCAVGYVTQPWYYLMFLAPAAVCLDAFFAAPGWRVIRLVIATAFAVTAFSQSGEILRQRSTDLDLVAAKLQPAVASGDLVLVNRWECAISLNRYYHGPAPLMTVPPIDDQTAHRFDLFLQSMGTADPLRPVFDAIASTLRRGGHVWFVGHPRLLAPGQSLLDLPPTALQRGDEEAFARYYYGWETQADEFLDTHAVRSSTVDVPLDAPVSTFENQDLWSFEGWRE